MQYNGLIYRHLCAQMKADAEWVPLQKQLKCPAKLKKVNFLEAKEVLQWGQDLLKFLQDAKLLSKRSLFKKDSLGSGEQLDMYTLTFAADISLKNDTIYLSVELDTKDVYLETNLSSIKKVRNAETLFQEIVAVLNPISAYRWAEGLQRRMESTLGMAVIPEISEPRHGEVRGVWQFVHPYNEGSIEMVLNYNDGQALWKMVWKEGPTQIFDAKSLTDLLDLAPSEDDSELVWFSSYDKHDEIQKMIEEASHIKNLGRTLAISGPDDLLNNDHVGVIEVAPLKAHNFGMSVQCAENWQGYIQYAFTATVRDGEGLALSTDQMRDIASLRRYLSKYDWAGKFQSILSKIQAPSTLIYDPFIGVFVLKIRVEEEGSLTDVIALIKQGRVASEDLQDQTFDLKGLKE